MKRIYFLLSIIFICFLSIPVFSQEEQDNSNEYEAQTLIDDDLVFSGYGACDLRLTTINSKIGLMVGGIGGLLINHTLLIGGAGLGTMFHDEVKERQSGVTFGGLYLEYIIFPEWMFHFAVGCLIGGGVVYSKVYTDPIHYITISESGFCVEPRVTLEINILSWFVISIGGTFRFFPGLSHPVLSWADYNGASATIAFKFGTF